MTDAPSPLDIAVRTGRGASANRVVIVGSGPAGATAAQVLSQAGWFVTVLEKGTNHLLDLEPPFAPKQHFSNDELKFGFRHFLGPDPIVEPRTFRRDPSDGERLHVGEVNNLPSTVGGGGVHADAKLPRFREEDFHLLSARGPIEGAALADWPVQYAELEPFYAQAERDIGVAGEAGANPFAAWRSGPYPMPPGPDMYGAVLSSDAAVRLGYHPYRAPTGINSVEYDGRPACVNCGFCGAAGCPIHAKGDPIAMLTAALRTGRCEIRPESHVTDIAMDSNRRARGVRYLDPQGVSHEIRADHILLACGAFETPRLLLRSGGSGDGLGNSSGLIGRHLMYHFQTMVLGVFPFRLHGHRGRAVTHLMDDPIVPDAEALAAARVAGLPYMRGGVVEHGAGAGPIQEAIHYPSGPIHPQLMADSPMRDKMWVFTMQGEDLPQVTNTVDLDPHVRDVWGLAAGRATYSPHRHELAAASYWAPKLEAVMRVSGSVSTFWVTSPPAGLGRHAGMEVSPSSMPSISRHVMGTCRMGDDPRASVVDRFGRCHELDNVWCIDSSVFVTSAGYNPTLTIAALAMRTAHHLAGLPPPQHA